jgi:elongation factor G
VIRKASGRRAVFGAGFQDHDRPVVGSAGVFRVYSGKLSAGESIYNVAKGRKERVGRLVRMHANKREDIQEILAGDICAAVGLKNVSTGDTICDESIRSCSNRSISRRR